MKARFFAIAALVLGLASCQKDFAPEVNSGDEVKVTLSVSAPELIGATRAGVNGEVDENKALDSRFGAIDYLDGNVAGDARWDWNDVDIRYTMEVYDQEDLTTPIKDRQEIIKDQYQQVEFEVRLIPNRNYQFVVFADFVDQETKQPLRHEIGATLNDIALVNEAILDEVADCYFKSWEFEPTNNTQNRTEATLTRPYAKVRVIATDLAELNLNVHPESVAIEYNTVIPTTFNAVKGSISGDNTTKTFTYNYIAEVRDNMVNHVYNADYDKKVDAKGRASHMTLFTDYILAEDEQDAINFKMTVSDKKGAIKVVDFNTEIPVQRNYLTTIIGDVLTTNVNVDVNISDDFAGEIVKNVNFVYDAEQLQDALNNTVEGDNTIVFGDDVVGDITASQVQGKNVIIDGNNKKFDGTILVVGNNGSTQTDTLVIKNINFSSEEDSIDFIQQNSQNAPGRYAHNITIENCTFNGKANAVGMRFRQCYNITVKNCVVESGHSLAQFISCTGITVDGVNVKADRGIALGTSKDCVVKNSTIEAGSYGLRAEPTSTLLVEKSTIKAAEPIVVRKLKSGSYSVTIDEASVLETANEFQIAFTNGDDGVAYELPLGTFTINDNNKFKVYPRNISEGVVYDGETFAVDSAEGLNWFAAYVNGGYNFAGKVVALAADVDLAGAEWTPVGTLDAKFNGVFDGQNNKIENLKIDSEGAVAMFAYVGEEAAFKNVTLENVDIKSARNAAGLLFCNYKDASAAYNGGNLLIENVTVSGNIECPNYAAGIAFDLANVTMKNCVNNANVVAGASAGLVAWIEKNGVLENVVNNGNVFGGTTAAGIANRFGGSIKNATNNGEITAEGPMPVAGIVAVNLTTSTYDYCYNYGKVVSKYNGANASAAGILGQASSTSNKPTFNYCANFGEIVAEQSHASGIFYSLYGSATANYCYNAGVVTGADGAGAIAAKPEFSGSNKINYCLDGGIATATAAINAKGKNVYTSCYYYNNGELLNVADNAVVAVEDALAVLNGGADAQFFVNENGVIVVK